MRLGLVTPAHGRYPVTRLAFAQRARLVAELAVRGITADQIVIADDDNLDLAAEFGFDAVHGDNVLGRRVNDGIERALERGADWVCFAGSDNWLHPDLFDAMFFQGPDAVVAGRTLAVVDLEGGRPPIVARVGGAKGAAPWLIPAPLLKTSRPVPDTATSGMEQRLFAGLGLPPFTFFDPNACCRVDFKTESNMTPYAAFTGGAVGEARLRDYYPADLCDLVDEFAAVAA